MMREVQDRINKLKLSINLLEDHLDTYGQIIEPIALRFIKSQINFYKHELQIRRDYPKD